MKKSPKKSSKKAPKPSPFRKKMRVVFWLCFAAVCLWVGLMPHHRAVSPNAITVKVAPPPEPAPEPVLPIEKPPVPDAIPPLPPTGEEPAPPKIQEHGAGISVPVTPEPPPPVPSSGHRPQIAIVIDDVGPDLKGSERAIQLPPVITLSFLPYAVRLREQTRQARDSGHEMLLHMPMEPLGHEDPGPGALLVDLPMPELQQRFDNALASFTGFDGVNNHMGSKFTAYADGMNMVVDELQQRHLFYLDSRTSAQSVGKKIAQEKGLPTIGRDVFLDDDQSPDVIRGQLEAAERVAQRKGFAVAIGHPHVATLNALDVWIPDVQKRGFDLVPVHDLIGR